MRRVIRTAAVLLCAGLLLALSACADRNGVTDPDRPNAAWVGTPTPYTDVTVGSATYAIWPWTTSTLTDAAPDDPANILIVGEGDPRAVRAALMSLGPSPALGCTWSDAIGDEQASAAAGVGWTGSAIQLACGDFGPGPRMHLRLFDIGDAIIAQAHFEIQIPGTSDHQVLSYAFAEMIALGELARTGLADPATFTLTPAITPTTHRTIPAMVYNLLPPELWAIVGVPGPVTSDVPIPNGDGMLTIVPMAHYTGPSVGSSQAFTLMFDQGVPKPFCQAPGDWVYVAGPVALSLTVAIAPDGTLERYFRAQGRLSVTPIDVSVSPPVPTGVPYRANVTQDHQAWATPTAHWVQAKLHQVLVPGRGPDRGTINTHLRVGSAVPDDFSYRENCGWIRP